MLTGERGRETKGRGPWGLAAPGGNRGESGQVLRLKRPPSLRRVSVCLVPAVRDPHMSTFLQQLWVDWPATSERAETESLRIRALAELSPAGDRGALPPGVLGSVCLKDLLEERGHAAGYDPNLDNCLGRTWSLFRARKAGTPAVLASPSLCVPFAVTEDLLSVLAELRAALLHWPEVGSRGLVRD